MSLYQNPVDSLINSLWDPLPDIQTQQPGVPGDADVASWGLHGEAGILAVGHIRQLA